MNIFLLFLVIISSVFSELIDGETRIDELDPDVDPWNIYLFKYTEQSLKNDLSIIVTSFSDFYDPNIFVAKDHSVSPSNYLYKSNSYGLGLIKIPNEELILNSNYSILVECLTYCRYSITLILQNSFSLQNGIPFKSTLHQSESLDLKFSPREDSSNYISISVQYSGEIQMFITKDSTLPSPENSLPVYNNWQGFLEFTDSSYKAKTSYLITLAGSLFSSFNIIATSSKSTCINLRSGVQQISQVERARYKHFSIAKNSNFDDLSISLTTYEGDADLFISLESFPSIFNNDFSSTHIGSDSIHIFKKDFEKLGFANGIIFIGVYGDTETRFGLVASFDYNNLALLSDGVPVQGLALKGEVRNFVYQLGAEDQKFSVYLVSVHGDADLAAKYCEGRCKVGKEEIDAGEQVSRSISSSTLQSLDFEYRHDMCGDDSGCQMAVAVVARENALFYVVAAKIDSPIILMESHPFVMSAPESGYKHFIYIISNDAASQVSFHITPIYGNPNLYISRSQLPSVDSYEKCSKNQGLDEDFIIYIKGEEDESLKSKYFISVFCEIGCYYSISAKSSIPNHNSSVQLYPGHPQKDILFKDQGEDFRLYSFFIGSTPSNYSTSTIYLSDFSQNIELQVRLEDSSQNHTWKLETSLNGSSLTIESTDPHFKPDSFYSILVHCIDFSLDGSCTYRIQYTATDDILMLSEDVSLSGSVKPKSYSYYSFPVHYSHEDLLLTLTVHSGDPDLFISFSFENERPSKEHHDLYSKHFGSEVLSLLWEEHLMQYCSGLGLNYTHGMAHGCFVFISVYSEYYSSYSIRIHPSLDIPRYLPPNSITYGHINQEQYDFLYSIIKSSQNYLIILQRISGDFDIFVNLADKEKTSMDREVWLRPNQDNSMIASKGLLTHEIFLSNETLARSCEAECILLISVMGKSKDSKYNIEVTSDEVTTLVEGKLTYAIVAEDYKYFLFECVKDYEGIYVLITKIYSCSVEMYASRGKESRPDVNQFNWEAEADSNGIFIDKDDQVFAGKSMKGFYVFAVVAGDAGCSFTIRVINHQYPVVLLSQGVPQAGEASSSAASFYAIHHGVKDDLVISLTPTSGQPFLVATAVDVWSFEVYSKLPSVDKHLWSTQYSHDPLTLRIKSTDPNFCINCYYIISVLSSNISFYSITSKTDLNLQIIQEGIPIKSEGSSQNWDIYSLQITQSLRFTVILSEFSQKSTLILSRSYTDLDMSWSPSSQSPNTISLDPNDPNFSIGLYYILVSSNSSIFIYSILWYHDNSKLTLIDGWPAQYSIPSSGPSDLLFSFTGSQSTFCILSSLTESFYPILIANYSNSTGSKEQVFNKFDYKGQDLFTSFSLSPNTKLLLKVVKYSEAPIKTGKFSFYCTSSFRPSLIQLNTMNYIHLPSHLNSWRFELNVGSASDVQIFVQACLGDLKVEISQNWTSENKVSDIALNEFNDGVIYGKIQQALGKYFIIVSKFQSDTAAFQIVVDSLSRERLYPGNKGIIERKGTGDLFELHWNGLEYINGTKFNGKVRYVVYVSGKTNLDLQTACQLEIAMMKKEVQLVYYGNETGTRVKGSLGESVYFLVAEINQDELPVIQDVFYLPLQASATEENSKVMVWVIISAIGVAVVAVIMAVVLYRKYKKADMEIKVIKEEIKNPDNTIFEESRIIGKFP